MQDPDVETVVVQLANLELTITARVLPSASSRAVEVTTTTARESAAIFEDPYRVPERLESQSISATRAPACAALSLGFLSHLTARLRGSDEEWNPAARIGRAFRAGVIARRQLDGQIQEGQSPGIPFRNSVYVVLRDQHHGVAFWTSSYPVYGRAVFAEDGRTFSNRTVSHAFASQAEAEAYCAGARTRWPDERRA